MGCVVYMHRPRSSLNLHISSPGVLTCFFVESHGQLWSLRSQQKGFCLAVFLALECNSSLANQDVADRVGVVRLCYALGIVPLLSVDIHEHSFLRLLALDKLLLGLAGSS